MSTTCYAMIFYGYVQPVREFVTEQSETPWDNAFGKNGTHHRDKDGLPYIVGWYGVHSFTAHYLAVRASHVLVELSETKAIPATHFSIDPTWDELLIRAAQEWQLDIKGFHPSWQLALLYVQ